MLDPKRGFVCSIALLALLLAAFTAVPAFAQVAGAAITGNVADSTGAVVANAEVTVKNMATDAVRTVSTNDSGFYTAQNLLPGGYSVIISAAGFSTVRRSDLTLSLGMNMVLNVELRVGSVNESIEIKGEAPNVELGTSALGASVRGETIRELPLNGSDWTSLALLEPSVAAVRTQKAVANNNDRANRGLGGFLTVAGARPQQNNYRIDGISINDSANRAPGSVLGVDLGVDSIQEFSVITSNATAEYGKSSGGVINAISRSGTNALHGSVYEFLRNSPLDSRNFFDNHIPPFKRNQFGASAGGQIKKDRTFYFVDYEGLRQIWASPWSVPYPPHGPLAVAIWLPGT